VIAGCHPLEHFFTLNFTPDLWPLNPNLSPSDYKFKIYIKHAMQEELTASSFSCAFSQLLYFILVVIFYDFYQYFIFF